jgi:hypothetical protein
MKYTKHLIGALLAAVVATALVASAAQADPEFYIGTLPSAFALAGLNLVSGLTKGATVALGGSELLLASGLAVFCEHQKGHGWINNVVLTGTKIGDGIGLAEVVYKENCRVLGAEATCKVVEPITALAKAELILHEVSGKKEPYVLFTGELEPVEKRFTLIKFENKGTETCLLPKEVKIHGSIAAEALLGDAIKQVLHFNDTVYKLMCNPKAEGTFLAVCSLKFGEEIAKLDSLPVLELLNGSIPEGYQQNAGKEWEVK